MYKMVDAQGARAAAATQSGQADSYDAQCNSVITLVSQEKRVPIRLLLHRSRCRRDTARARQLAMYLCHVALGRSLKEIAHIFGRDRTTVSHACALMEDMRDNRTFDEAVSALEHRIESEGEAETDHGYR
ncbi:helix-turn-helix domain-containing protein [uncultured Devosia sp.]|uniref:helix-turn-helix domain-containing protein n=1 Tax=uncultured Devosia sp. TaxID=211434 RepID=UPI0035CC9243